MSRRWPHPDRQRSTLAAVLTRERRAGKAAAAQLQTAAVRDGLVDRLGQDEVQRIMSEAFAVVRDWP